MDGVLNVNKPAGPTSHDVVARVRRMTGEKRIGHAGTLDPDACGVLALCLGQATRVVEYLTEWRKSYRAVVAFGAETDTEDASGKVMRKCDCSSVTREDVEAVLPMFTGDIMQAPPMVSAVHHQGKRLYELARAGEFVDREPRPVSVYSVTLGEFTPGQEPTAVLDVQCSRGTYIRTLCADIGKAVGCGAHMGSLVRTAVGDFTLESALSLDEIGVYASEGRMGEILMSINDAISSMPMVTVSEEDAGRIRNGIKLPADDWSEATSVSIGSPVKICAPNGSLIAIGKFAANDAGCMILRPVKVLSELL